MNNMHDFNNLEGNSLVKSLKQFWNWLWNSDSIWSYVLFLVIVFIVVKFIFLPGIGLVFGTSLPLAIVESSSMEHYSLTENGVNYVLCGKTFNEKKAFNFDNYWGECGSWYESNAKINITKSEFSEFRFRNGFRKGDIMVIFGRSFDKIKVGNVIVFDGGRNHPIIHRVVAINSDGSLQTKGDHNNGQLSEELNIKESQVIGVAVGRVPYLGWLKLFFAQMLGRAG